MPVKLMKEGATMSGTYQDTRNEQYYQQYQQSQYQPRPPRKRSLAWLWILLAVLACLVLFAWWISTLPLKGETRDDSLARLPGPYLAVLYVEGTMTVGNYRQDLSSYTELTYDQQYYLDTIDSLMADDQNAGLLLYVDSPGGQILAADELGQKVAAYQAETGRPVYAYGYSYAASGGYWVLATADKIVMNPYCVTGSIGVTMGNLIDLTGLLEKYGVKSYNLASGGEKNAANGLTPITQETIDVYQGMIDEYYEDFLDWVAEGRGLDKETLRPLADGRLYTARQALENGLIDEVGDYDQALAELMEQTGVANVYDYYPAAASKGLLGLLLGRDAQKSELDTLLYLLPPQGLLAYYNGVW